MRSIRLKSWTMAVALVAAYMLVLHGLLGSFAMAAAPVNPMLDAFGNPLCITSTDTATAGLGHADHSILPDCCMAACGMFAPATADDRSPPSLSNPLLPALPSLRAADSVVHTPETASGPGNPRAPPLTV